MLILLRARLLLNCFLPTGATASLEATKAKAADESGPVSALENKSQSVVSAALEAPAASPYKMSEESFKY